jgi:hypothetical protein|eukprot:COSAG06_NODE_1792_length_8393_cov_4.896552_11_plen_86_part_00
MSHSKYNAFRRDHDHARRASARLEVQRPSAPGLARLSVSCWLLRPQDATKALMDAAEPEPAVDVSVEVRCPRPPVCLSVGRSIRT